MTITETIEPTELPESHEQIGNGRAWIAGALGAAIALSLGEFIARFSESLESLVVGIGNLFIDLTPGSVIATSINNIGAWQKPLLVGGIIVGAIAVGGWLAITQLTKTKAVPIGFAVFGILGGFAAARGEMTNAAASWIVALVCALVGALVTLGLLQILRPTEGDPQVVATPGQPLSQTAGRRRVLAFGGAAAGTAALTLGSRIGRTSAAQRARNEILAGTTGTTVPGSTDAFTPPIDLPVGAFDDLTGITSRITPISPNDDFYLIDTAIIKPQVDPSTWTLSIGGPYVDNPISFTYEELLARDLVTEEVTLSCVSNPIGGPLVGNAVWEGIPLAELLEEAGVQDPTNPEHQFFSRSVDGFTCGFPLPLTFDGRTAMLALKMNGEPLPIDHGFPARIVVAGLYGYVSATKWISEIEITDWIGVDGHWIPLGWGKEGPIKTSSRIDLPQNQTQFAAGPNTLGGIAWSPTIGIERVEVYIGQDVDESLNDDSAWQEVELANTETDETWVQWRHEWNAEPGDWLIRVRATDKNGVTESPIPVNPAPDGAEGWHSIVVRTV